MGDPVERTAGEKRRVYPDDLTDSERAAIRALGRLGKTWPRSLKLVSAAGSLVVCENDNADLFTPIVNLPDLQRIVNDGGDPGWTLEPEESQARDE